MEDGNRITIDCATLMNKGFEVIEACWLFDFSPSQVEVVIHPQSSVHAMIEYSDGSVLAQICATDMRMPIQYALTYPDRFEAPVPKLNWAEARTWNSCRLISTSSRSSNWLTSARKPAGPPPALERRG